MSRQRTSVESDELTQATSQKAFQNEGHILNLSCCPFILKAAFLSSSPHAFGESGHAGLRAEQQDVLSQKEKEFSEYELNKNIFGVCEM